MEFISNRIVLSTVHVYAHTVVTWFSAVLSTQAYYGFESRTRVQHLLMSVLILILHIL